MHDEWPGGSNSETHGLQIFVNLPEASRGADSYALHVKAEDIPVQERDTAQIRVVAGRCGELQSLAVLPQEFSLFDCSLGARARVDLAVLAGGSMWFCAMQGDIALHVDLQNEIRGAGYSAAIYPGSGAGLTVEDHSDSRFVMMSGAPEPLSGEAPHPACEARRHFARPIVSVIPVCR